MNTLTTAATAALLGVGILVLVGLLYAIFLATPVWLLWNALMPALFGFKLISWWQAFGLALLARLLFTGSSSSSSSN